LRGATGVIFVPLVQLKGQGRRLTSTTLFPFICVVLLGWALHRKIITIISQVKYTVYDFRCDSLAFVVAVTEDSFVIAALAADQTIIPMKSNISYHLSSEKERHPLL
jgi:hypothetical protein